MNLQFVTTDWCLFVQLLPKHSAAIILAQVQKRREKRKDKKEKEIEKPGEESVRKNREVFTRSVHVKYGLYFFWVVGGEEAALYIFSLFFSSYKIDKLHMAETITYCSIYCNSIHLMFAAGWINCTWL